MGHPENRSERRITRRRKHERLSGIIDCHKGYRPWLTFGFRRGDDGGWVENRSVVKQFMNTRKGYLKRASNRKYRKTADDSPKGNLYRRYFDYWWELY